jgi:hypothetical protein
MPERTFIVPVAPRKASSGLSVDVDAVVRVKLR